MGSRRSRFADRIKRTIGCGSFKIVQSLLMFQKQTIICVGISQISSFKLVTVKPSRKTGFLEKYTVEDGHAQHFYEHQICNEKANKINSVIQVHKNKLLGVV